MSHFETNEKFDYRQQIDRLDDLIKRGQKSVVIQQLNAIDYRKVPRQYKSEFALLAGRIDENKLALKILNPIVRKKNSQDKSATHEELVIYAGALTNLGFNTEALEIYDKISSQEFPDSLLHQAWIKFAMWDYASAVPLLKKYLLSKNISDYKKLVGQVNLLAALVSLGKVSSSFKLCNELLVVTKLNNHQLLFGNTLELQAQIYIFNGQYEKALPILQEAQNILNQFPGLYLDFVIKWKLICQLMLASKNRLNDQKNFKKIVVELQNFKIQSQLKDLWETARDCDLFLALANQNEIDLLTVIYKSESSSYKRRAIRLWQSHYCRKIKLRHKKIIRINDQNQSSSNEESILDVRDRSILNNPALQRLFEILSRDLYKPFSLGTLFNVMHSGEYYDPNSSDKRIQNIVYLARKWLKQHHPAVKIIMRNGGFNITGVGNIITYQKKFNKSACYLEKFNCKVSFSCLEFANQLHISKRSAQKIISELILNKKVIPIGRGRSVRYVLNSIRTAKVDLIRVA